jgi:surface protein
MSTFDLVYNFAVGTPPSFPFTLTLPIVGGTVTSIDWGDGTTTGAGVIQNDYAATGTYTVQITWTGASAGSFNYFGGTGKQYLTACTSFGNTGLTNASAMFAGTTNLASVPATLPSSFTNLTEMFIGSSFAGDANISGWDVSNVTSMEGMFREMSAFNQPIGSWTPSNCVNFGSMFYLNTGFNQSLNGWTLTTDIAKTINMAGMFNSASAFNGNISSWNTSRVNDMSNMFGAAIAFNQNISGWDTSSVVNMYGMFNGAAAFNQNLGGWNISQVTDMNDMLNGSTLSTTNYDATLTGWAAQTVQPNVGLGATGLTYSALAAHNTLTGAPNNWNITGDTYAPAPVICFKEGSKILTDKGYVAVQDLRNGDLIETVSSGFKKIEHIGNSKMYNNVNGIRSTDKLYKCSTSEYPELSEDLVITGGHSILVKSFKDSDQIEKTQEVLGKIYVTDGHYRLPACVDDRTKMFEEEGVHTIWHFSLEHSNYYMNYGIYANGLLVETASNRMMVELSGMTLL